MIKETIRQGLGEKAEFATYHPVVNLIFFLFVIGITMFSMDPAFLTATLVLSLSLIHI